MSDDNGDRQGIGVDVGGDFVATVELRRPPNNLLDADLTRRLADTLLELDGDRRCRAVVLAAAGRHFCAGVDVVSRRQAVIDGAAPPASNPIYDEGARICEATKPVVAAVQGGAIGGGLALALLCDFRVGSPETRMAANFARLGMHHGFGLTITLPAVAGQQRAQELLYTGRRVDGGAAFAMGLLDRLVPQGSLRAEAHSLAAEIASAAPLAVRSIRRTLRGDLADGLRRATAKEWVEQCALRSTADQAEGLLAAREHREPRFEER
ncbi:MAG TPA: enoyl-CoA hydratase/isomerase family protein [Acidimicrobiales bacterium]|nr:enoyl-CoA hydratase/isomerase family protein [Acidimicrobiales bacterium]